MPTPTRDDLRNAFWRFEATLMQVFGLYIWKIHFLPRIQEPKPEPPYFVILKNALVTSSLLAIRSVDDFFRPVTARRQDDDFRSTDYAFTPVDVLSGDERVRINRNIVHLSHDPAWRPEFHQRGGRQVGFDIVELGVKAASESVRFMDYYARSDYLDSAIERERVMQARRAITAMMFNMTVIGEREQSSAGGDTGSPTSV